MTVFWFLLRSRYFRGKRFFGDFEIHVEQADIKDLTVTASAERGCTVSMAVLSPSGSRVVRSFRPDFFLCRQSVRDASKDYRNVLLGLNIGGVPSINSLHSLYNFQVRKLLSTLSCDILLLLITSCNNN
jgi:synapsin